MKCIQFRLCLVLVSALMLPTAWAQTYDINTLAGKVASVNGTAGLQIRHASDQHPERVRRWVLR